MFEKFPETSGATAKRKEGRVGWGEVAIRPESRIFFVSVFLLLLYVDALLFSTECD